MQALLSWTAYIGLGLLALAMGVAAWEHRARQAAGRRPPVLGAPVRDVDLPLDTLAPAPVAGADNPKPTAAAAPPSIGTNATALSILIRRGHLR